MLRTFKYKNEKNYCQVYGVSLFLRIFLPRSRVKKKKLILKKKNNFKKQKKEFKKKNQFFKKNKLLSLISEFYVFLERKENEDLIYQLFA